MFFSKKKQQKAASEAGCDNIKPVLHVTGCLKDYQKY